MAKDPYASLKQGLVGAWIPSVSGSGLLLPDLSGRGNNGALTNMDASDWVSSGTGRALDFDGVNDYVAVPHAQRLNFTAELSFAAWVVKTSSSACNLLGKQNVGVNDGNYAVISQATNNLQFGFVTSVANTRWSTTGAVFTLNALTHIALTIRFDAASAAIIKAYANGVEQSGSWTTASGIGIPLTNTNPVAIFAASDGSINHFPGQLLEMRLYNRILTDPEIRLLSSDRGIGFKSNKKLSRFSTRYTYNPPKAKVYHTVKVRERDHKNLREGLVGAWCPSLSGSGNLLPDVSGRNNHGTLTNMGPEDWVSSQGGRALDFDGTDDAVDLSAYAAQYSTLTSGTLSLWFNLRSQTVNDVFGLSETSTTNNRFAIAFGNSTPGFTDESLVVVLVINSTVSFAGFVRKGEAFYYDNTWHSLVFTGGNAGNAVYIDGIKQTLTYTFGSSSTAGFLNILNANSMSIGRRNLTGLASNFTNGRMDDVRIYNRILTPSEISLLASKRGIGLTHPTYRSYSKEKKTALRRLLLTGQT